MPIEAISACAADLRRVPIFEDLEESKLDWLLEHGDCIALEPGDALWEKGQEADHMYIVLEGSVQIFLEVAGQTVTGSSDRWGQVMGLLPYSRMVEFPGQGVATVPSRVLGVAREHFDEMLRAIPELGYQLVAVMMDRVRESTRAESQREKMMALGKLSAGLSHELNNPAAAAQRNAAELQGRLASSSDKILQLLEHRLDPEQMAVLVRLRGHRESVTLSTLERGEREDEIGEWLEDLGAEDGFVMAETFVDAGYTVDELSEAVESIPESAQADALAWVESGLGAGQLITQIGVASGRISELVKAVKAYSHRDGNPNQQLADLHVGIEETLTILRHSLKEKRVRVNTRYNDALPQLPLYLSEINQVWTNLIDNAIDAVDEEGEVRVETDLDGCFARVKIIDNGPGIPEDIRSRIFEPFFTTKDVGDGTGLGLDIVQRIVAQHKGEIRCESEPGRTEMIVRLPLPEEM